MTSNAPGAGQDIQLSEESRSPRLGGMTTQRTRPARDLVRLIKSTQAELIAVEAELHEYRTPSLDGRTIEQWLADARARLARQDELRERIEGLQTRILGLLQELEDTLSPHNQWIATLVAGRR